MFEFKTEETSCRTISRDAVDGISALEVDKSGKRYTIISVKREYIYFVDEMRVKKRGKEENEKKRHLCVCECACMRERERKREREREREVQG